MTSMFEQVEELTVDAIKEKYQNDPEKAWEALLHSQRHIPKIEAENREYKEYAAKAKTLEEVLAALKGTQNSQVPPVLPNPSVNVEPNEPAQQSVESQIASYLDRQRAEEAQQRNRQQVADLLKDRFKDKAPERFAQLAQESGFTVAEFEALASRNPKAVLKLAGLDSTQQANSGPSKATVNPEALKQVKGNGSKPGTFSYYEKMRRENPSLWQTSKVQNEIIVAYDRDPDFYLNN